MNIELSALLATTLSTTLIRFTNTGSKPSLRNVTVHSEYKVERFLVPGMNTSITGAPVDSYGVEFYNDQQEIVCIDLTDGKSSWIMRNVDTGEIITSEDGKAQVESEDAVSAMMKVVGEIVAASGDVEIQQLHDETVLAVKGMTMAQAQAHFASKLLEILLSADSDEIKPGDTVKCVRSEHLGDLFYEVGSVYTVARVDVEGNFTLEGTITEEQNRFIPLEGNVWAFEKV